MAMTLLARVICQLWPGWGSVLIKLGLEDAAAALLEPLLTSLEGIL
jgi:hypothetical protein